MKRWILNILIVIFAGVFLVSAGVLGKYIWDSAAQRRKEQEMALLVDRPQTRPTPPPETVPPETTVPSASGETAPSTEPTEPVETEPPYEYEEVVTESGETVRILKDYAELFRLNNDLVGWIQIPDTKIDYPVMQTPDSEDYYLHRDIYGDYSRHGTIYVRESCDVFAPSDNVTIYGHNMKDGSMFGGLMKYKTKGADFYHHHAYIDLNTLYENARYVIFAICEVDIRSTQPDYLPFWQDVRFESAERFSSYVERARSLSQLRCSVDVQPGDRLLTLSTCITSDQNKRLLIMARKLRPDEDEFQLNISVLSASDR